MSVLTSKTSSRATPPDCHLFCCRSNNYHQRATDKGVAGKQMVEWQRVLEEKWATLRFGELKTETKGDEHLFEVQVHLDGLDPHSVRVELYGNVVEGRAGDRREMQLFRQLDGETGGYVYSAVVPATRPAADYTARMIPHFDGVATPLEDARVIWQR